VIVPNRHSPFKHPHAFWLLLHAHELTHTQRLVDDRHARASNGLMRYKGKLWIDATHSNESWIDATHSNESWIDATHSNESCHTDASCHTLPSFTHTPTHPYTCWRMVSYTSCLTENPHCNTQHNTPAGAWHPEEGVAFRVASGAIALVSALGPVQATILLACHLRLTDAPCR